MPRQQPVARSLWDGGSGVQIVCGGWDAPMEFTLLDSVESGGALSVTIRLDETLTVVYTADP